MSWSGAPISGWRPFHPVYVASGTLMSGKRIPLRSFPSRIYCGHKVGIGLAYFGRQCRRYPCLGLRSKVEPDNAGQMGGELHVRDS